MMDRLLEAKAEIANAVEQGHSFTYRGCLADTKVQRDCSMTILVRQLCINRVRAIEISTNKKSNRSDTDFVLHVGPMKTATTYIQYILEVNRPELDSLGWTYPGQRPNQQHAFYGICGTNIPWISEDKAKNYAASGKALVEALSSHSLNKIVSCEALASLTEDGIEQLLTKIPAPSKVVFTLRSLPVTLKSGWQQLLKGGSDMSLDDFISIAVNEPIDTSSPQDILLTYLYGEAVRRWSKVAQCPIHLAEVPSSSDPDITWQVFRAAASMPELPDRVVPRSNSNRSLSSDAAELLRRFNATFISTKTLRPQRQVEFVRDCLLAEPYLALGSKQIEFDSQTMDLLEAADAKQRAISRENATLLFTSDNLEGIQLKHQNMRDSEV